MRTLPDSTVFTRAEARACGWSDAAITRAVRAGRLVRMRRGLLASGQPMDHVLLSAAAARSCAGSVVSHRSALLLHDLPVVGQRPPVPELTVGPRRVGSLTSAHLYRATLRPEDVIEVNGMPVTSIARTLVDVGRHRSTATAVAAIDAALHRGLVGEPELDEMSLACWNWPGIRRALRAIRLADARAESPLESGSRLVLRRLVVAEALPQAQMYDECDRFCGRTDFYWDDAGVVGEADGRSKYDTRPVLTEEKDRQERLEELGLIVVRWGWADVTRNRPHLRIRLERAFERGRARDRSGFRRLWSVRAA